MGNFGIADFVEKNNKSSKAYIISFDININEFICISNYLTLLKDIFSVSIPVVYDQNLQNSTPPSRGIR